MKWPMVKLGDVCHLMTGGTPKTTVTEYYVNGTVPWIVSGDIHKQEIFDCEKRITEHAVENSNARYLPRDSVLIALNGQGKTRGTVALLRFDGATCNQSIVSINPIDKDKLFPDFLFYYLKSQYQNIRNITGDKDRAGLNMPLIRCIEIPLPPLEEQKRIAAILDKADAIRRKRQQAIDLADEFLRSVFLDMFGDPVTNPKGWEVKTVAELIGDGVIIQVQDGNHGNDHPKVADFVSSGVPFVTANVVKRGKILFEQCFYLEDEWLEKLRIGFAKPRDVLISHKGSLGFTAVLDHTYENYIFSPQTTYYRLDESRMIPEYLKGYFDSGYFQNLFAKEGIQSTRAYLGITRQKDLPIMIPPLSEQEQYVKALSVYGNASNKLVNLNDYSNLFSALSQKAFSGEL